MDEENNMTAQDERSPAGHRDTPANEPLTAVVPRWYHSDMEAPPMKKSKTKADIVQSTLRLPRAIWVRINHIAALKNLSMQQAVQQAIVEYCRREGN